MEVAIPTEDKPISDINQPRITESNSVVSLPGPINEDIQYSFYYLTSISEPVDFTRITGGYTNVTSAVDSYPGVLGTPDINQLQITKLSSAHDHQLDQDPQCQLIVYSENLC